MFDSHFFDSPLPLFYGALTGLAFGFLLQKGGVTRFEVIVGQFLLRDFTVCKIMVSAILVGGVGVYGMYEAGWIGGLQIKAAHLAANAIGGVIFGVGMAILGYCPGTGVAAIGDGARDAVAGVLGMLFGAAVYAETHGWMKAHVLSVGDLGKESLPGWADVSPWWFFLGLTVLGGVAVLMISSRRVPSQPTGATDDDRVGAEAESPSSIDCFVSPHTNIIECVIDGSIREEDLKEFQATCQRLIKDRGSIRILKEIRNIDTIEPLAFWDNLRFSLRHLKDIERCAVVADKAWIRAWERLSKPLVRGEVRFFDSSGSVEARQWLGAEKAQSEAG